MKGGTPTVIPMLRMRMPLKISLPTRRGNILKGHRMDRTMTGMESQTIRSMISMLLSSQEIARIAMLR
jgi:hypothetical protein